MVTYYRLELGLNKARSRRILELAEETRLFSTLHTDEQIREIIESVAAKSGFADDTTRGLR